MPSGQLHGMGSYGGRGGVGVGVGLYVTTATIPATDLAYTPPYPDGRVVRAAAADHAQYMMYPPCRIIPPLAHHPLQLPPVPAMFPATPYLSAPPPLIGTSADSASADQSKACWGAVLQGTSVNCTPGFTTGQFHFKNKFCPICRAGIDVPVGGVRALTPEMHEALANSSNTSCLAKGFWKNAPLAFGGGQMRIINNTLKCALPWLVCYREEPPSLDWAPLPPQWVSEQGLVRLCVAKGTLSPVWPARQAPRARCDALPTQVGQHATAGSIAVDGANGSSRQRHPHRQEPQPTHARCHGRAADAAMRHARHTGGWVGAHLSLQSTEMG